MYRINLVNMFNEILYSHVEINKDQKLQLKHDIAYIADHLVSQLERECLIGYVDEDVKNE